MYLSEVLVVMWGSGSLQDLVILEAFILEMRLKIDMLSWLERAKLCTVIDERKLLILDAYNEVGFAIAVDITNFSSHWCQVLTISK